MFIKSVQVVGVDVVESLVCICVARRNTNTTWMREPCVIPGGSHGGLVVGKTRMTLLQLKEATEEESGHSNKPPDPETIAIGAEKVDTGKRCGRNDVTNESQRAFTRESFA
jgi:hypothetical protein